MKPRLILLPLLATTCLSACSLAPAYHQSITGFVAPQWPAGAAYPEASAQTTGLTWQDLVTDDNLRQVIRQALAHNQDMAAAVANVASARAQYGEQRASQFPALAASSEGTQVSPAGQTNGRTTTKDYTASIGVSAFTLDLFGRQKNLSKAAFEQYLSTQSGEKETRLTLIAETATAYVTLAADAQLLATARAEVASAERTLTLTKDLHDRGLDSGADVADAETTLAQARADVESYTTEVAQSRNALELLTGGPVADDLLPASLTDLDAAVHLPPAGLSSDVLLQRPDVIEAEHALKATYADIGAARAAFFPTISLTSTLGTASTALSKLFSAGNGTWTNDLTASMPLVGGSTGAALDYAKAQRDYYLAAYRKTAQSAYKDVADALARQGTIGRQRAAEDEAVAAAGRSYTIAEARYKAGADSGLQALIAQRTLYAARQSAVSLALTDIGNRIALYEALGADGSL